MPRINTGVGYCQLHKHLKMENMGNSGGESMQGRLARSTLQAFESVQQHSISNQGSETADGTQPPLQQQSGGPATAQRKRNATEISDADRAAKKREADREYRAKKKAEEQKIKSEWAKFGPENEQLKLKIGELNSKLETLPIMKLQIEEKNQIIQEKDQQMESLKAKNEQLKFQILEERNKATKATAEKLEAEKKLLEYQNELLQRDLAIANQSSQTQLIEQRPHPPQPYEGLTQHALQRTLGRPDKLELCSTLSSLQSSSETFLNSISSPIMPFLTPREMDTERATLRILRALIILVERTPRSYFERLRDRDDLVKELTRIILQVKRRLAAGMHTLRTLRSHFELPRDGGDLDILVRDSAGKIWKFRCCSARVTCRPVIFGGWVFFFPNQMSSK